MCLDEGPVGLSGISLVYAFWTGWFDVTVGSLPSIFPALDYLEARMVFPHFFLLF
jgi:hypothetical protein